jgi:hypothetical protein
MPQGFEPLKFTRILTPMTHQYRGWNVSFNRLARVWYAWDSQKHIRETRIEATTQEQILRMVEAATPHYKPPIFGFMAA